MKDKELVVWGTNVEVSRFSNFENLIKRLSFVYRVEILSYNSSKKWLRDSVSFELRGLNNNLNGFKYSLLRRLEEHNRSC